MKGHWKHSIQDNANLSKFLRGFNLVGDYPLNNTGARCPQGVCKRSFTSKIKTRGVPKWHSQGAPLVWIPAVELPPEKSLSQPLT